MTDTERIARLAYKLDPKRLSAAETCVKISTKVRNGVVSWRVWGCAWRPSLAQAIDLYVGETQ